MISVGDCSQLIEDFCKILDMLEYHALLTFLSDAHIDYSKIFQPHLNDFKLHVFGEWTDNLYFKFSHIIELANTHLVYKPTLRNFSGTDLEQDAESFLQLIGRRIIFATGGCTATWQKLSSQREHFFHPNSDDPLPGGTKTTLKLLPFEQIHVNILLQCLLILQ